MPKIFLIKNRLHQQQLRLLESQNLIQAKNENRLNIGDSSHQEHDDREPLSLVAKKRNTEDNSASLQQTADDQQKRNDSGENSINSIRVLRQSLLSSLMHIPNLICSHFPLLRSRIEAENRAKSSQYF
jgi:hypothetical protein